jgi:trans-2,3-dihydro-3-hydroxyanthranilate isomerase
MHDLTRRDLGRLALATVVPATAQRSGATPGRYGYVHLDVFTERPYEGNQLLTFLEPNGLDADAMQTITRESNYSECTFIFRPQATGVDHQVRIFTRTAETPFAGHPTIGSAFALAHSGAITAGTARTMFLLGVGPTPIDLEWDGARLKFAWMTQLVPTFGKTLTDRAALAAALGIEPSALASDRVPAAQEVHTGSNFLIVPIATRKAVDAAVLDRVKMDAVCAAAGIQRRGVYVCSTEAAPDGATAYTRLLSAGGIEDPATGSAAGPAASFLVKYGLVPASQASRIRFLQGVLVRRPSHIHANVGGTAVVVGEGSVSWGA